MNKETLISYKNIYCVPSYHYQPEFAIEVQRYCDIIQPDCIAIEASNSYKHLIEKGISYLPALTSIYSVSENHYGITPVIETDSIISAANHAIKNKMPWYCIDMENIPYMDRGDRQLLLDAVFLEKWDLNYFYRLFTQYKSKRLKVDIQRDKCMAYWLNELSNNYDRILFVCGAAHWENIQYCIENNIFLKPSNSPKIKDNNSLVELTPRSIYNVFGMLPYLIHVFNNEKNKVDIKRFDLLIKSVLHTSKIKKIKIDNRDLQTFIKFTRNLSIYDNHFFPGLYNTIVSIMGVTDDPFPYEFYELLLSYPESNNPTGLKKIDVKEPLQPLEGKKPLYLTKFTKKMFRPLPKLKDKYGRQFKHPDAGNKDFVPKLRGNWWSFPLENKFYHEFLYSLMVTASENIEKEEFDSNKFSSGLMDGIDYRSSVKDVLRDNIYVKESNVTDFNIGAIYIEFDESEYESNYFYRMGWTKYMHRLECSLYPEEKNKGIYLFQHGAFTDFCYTIEDKVLDGIFDKSLIKFYPGYSNNFKWLWKSAIFYSIKKDIVFYTYKPPTDEQLEFADKNGKQIHYIDVNTIPKKKRILISQSHYHPPPKWYLDKHPELKNPLL